MNSNVLNSSRLAGSSLLPIETTLGLLIMIFFFTLFTLPQFLPNTPSVPGSQRDPHDFWSSGLRRLLWAGLLLLMPTQI